MATAGDSVDAPAAGDETDNIKNSRTHWYISCMCEGARCQTLMHAFISLHKLFPRLFQTFVHGSHALGAINCVSMLTA